MGEPATPTPAERHARHQLAADIVGSVVDDEPMPLPFEWPKTPTDCPDCPETDVENLIFEFAQEITLLVSERIDTLIENSSFGTPQAKEIRASADPKAVAQVMARVHELEHAHAIRFARDVVSAVERGTEQQFREYRLDAIISLSKALVFVVAELAHHTKEAS